MIRNRRSTWSSGDRPKADLHVGEEWEQLSPKEREVAAALRTHFGEEKFASIPGDLVVPFIRGYAEETSCEGPGFVQQLLELLGVDAHQRVERVVVVVVRHRVAPADALGDLI